MSYNRRASVATDSATPWTELAARLPEVRRHTESLCTPLATEDYGIQSMPDVSPPKWHLAHTTWFFETFILRPFASQYRVYDADYEYLFNSYYQTVGTPYPRTQRGQLSRPTVEDVYRYRAHVDAALARLLVECPEEHRDTVQQRAVLGIHHEQQHQELLLTDIKHILSLNRAGPVYRQRELLSARVPALEWIGYPGGVYEIGHSGETFAFDNETPRHRVFINDFVLATRPVTNGEYLGFMDAGGYQQPTLWLSDGWNDVRTQGWQAPLYWQKRDGKWWMYTLNGWREVAEHEPLCHVSYYEADAYARWAGKRLPTEAEWEVAAAPQPIAGNFVEAGLLHPVPAHAQTGLTQLYGDVWEWTQSDYCSYPGYKPLPGALGEYNGKFMVNQRVLRGGSCVSPHSHLRATYRNFFYPNTRWQFSGIRLAGDK